MADFVIRGEVIAESRQVSGAFRDIREQVNGIARTFGSASAQMMAESDNLVDEMEGYKRVLRDVRVEQTRQSQERLDQLRRETEAQKRTTVAQAERRFDRRTAGPLRDLENERAAVLRLRQAYTQQNAQFLAAQRAHEAAVNRSVLADNNAVAASNRLEAATERLAQAEKMLEAQERGEFGATQITSAGYKKQREEVEKLTAAMEAARVEAASANRALPGFQRNLAIRRTGEQGAGAALQGGEAQLAAQEATTAAAIGLEEDRLKRTKVFIKDAADYRIQQATRGEQAVRDEIDHTRNNINDALVDHRRFAEQARRAAFDVANAYTSLGSAVRNFGALVRQAGIGLTIGLTAPIAIMGKMGLQFNNVRDQAEIAFATMYRGAGFVNDAGARADDTLERLFTLARTSPFEFENVVKSAQSLVLAGQTDTGGLIKLLQDIGDTAAASGGDADKMGNKIERLTGIFSKIGLQGRLRLVDIKQLNLLMPAQNFLLEAWRKKMGDTSITATEFRKSVTKGMVDSGFAIKALQEGMERNFGGMAEALRNTFPGALSELKDTFAVFAGSVFKPVQVELTKLIRFVSAHLEEWRTEWEKLSPLTKRIIADILIGLALIGPALLGASVVINTIGSALTFVGGTIRGFASLLGPVITALGGWGNLVDAFFSDIIAFSGPITVVVAAFAIGWRLVEDNIGALYAAWIGLRKAFDEWLSGPGLAVVNTFAEAWQGLKDAVSFVWESIISIFQAGVDVVVQFFMENWDTIKAAVANLTVIFYEVYTAAKAIFVDAFGPIWTILLGAIRETFAAIKTIVLIAFDAISGVVGFIVNLFAGDIPGAMRAMSKAAGRILRDLADFFLSWFDAIWQTLKSWWKQVSEFLKSIWTWITSQSSTSLLTIFKNFYEWSKSVVKLLIDTFKNAGKEALAGFWEGWASGGDRQAENQFEFPNFQLPDFTTIPEVPGPAGGDNLSALGDDSAIAQAKQKADQVAKFIEGLRQKVDELREAFTLTDHDIEDFTEKFKGYADGTYTFAESVGQVIKTMRAIDDSTAGGTFANKWAQATEKAKGATEKFLETHKNDEHLTADRIAEIWELTRKKIFLDRLVLLRKAEEFETSSDEKIAQIRADTAKLSLSAYEGDLQEKQALIDKFAHDARESTANSQEYIDRLRSALDAQFLAKQQRAFRDADDKIRDNQIDMIQDVEVREKASLDRRIELYEREIHDRFGDTYEAELRIIQMKRMLNERYERDKQERDFARLKEWRDLQLDLIADPQIRQAQELQNNLQDDYQQAWAETGDAIYAAAVAVAKYNIAVGKLKLSAQQEVADSFAKENPFMTNIAKGLGTTLTDIIPPELSEKLRAMGETVQSLGEKFGFVANNAWALRNQIEAMQNFSQGNLFSGMISSLQALGFSLLTNAQVWVSLGQAIGKALSGASGEMENFGRLMLSSVLTTMGQIAIQMGTSMVAIGSLLTSTILFAAQGAAMVTNGIIMIALGVGLVAAGTALAPSGGAAASAGTASGATSAGSAGGAGGREHKTPKRSFATSGEVTVNVNLNATKDSKMARVMLSMLEVEGALTTKSIKGRHRDAVRRATKGNK